MARRVVTQEQLHIHRRGFSSTLGHSIQYRFYWGDATYSTWSSAASATKSWSSPGTYGVKAQARCATHPSIESTWSGGSMLTYRRDGFSAFAPKRTGQWSHWFELQLFYKELFPMLVIPLNIDFIGVTEAIRPGHLQRVQQSRGLLQELMALRPKPVVPPTLPLNRLGPGCSVLTYRPRRFLRPRFQADLPVESLV